MATHSSILAWRIPMGRGAWWVIDHGVTKSRTGLSDFTFLSLHFSWASLVAQTVKNLRAVQQTRARSPEERNGNPLQYYCLENPHGQRRLEGYSP